MSEVPFNCATARLIATHIIEAYDSAPRRAENLMSRLKEMGEDKWPNPVTFHAALVESYRSLVGGKEARDDAEKLLEALDNGR